METGPGRSIGISASREESDSPSLTERLLGPLLARSEGSAQRELLSLRSETDVELLGEGLLSFAARQERGGHEALAAEVYAALGEAETNLFPASMVGRAQRRFNALNGQGEIGDRAEVLARHFVQEATDPITLLAMTVGSAAYATARVSFLSRFAVAPAGVFTRGLSARAMAAGGAFAIEIPAFWAVNKGLREVSHPGSQSWDLATNARELATLSLSLGALKLAGFGAATVHQRAGLRNPLGATLFQQAGMFTGILAGHGLERWVGLRPASDGATTLLDSLVLLMQFNVGARLSHQLMGSRGSARSAELEARLQRALERPRTTNLSWGEGIDSPLVMAMAGGNGSSRRPGEGLELNRPQISMMEANGAGDSPARVWRNLFQDVLSRGRRHEVEALKNLLREALASQSGKSYIARQLDRWTTKDPEEWKSGIARISEMLENTTGVLGAVEAVEGLRSFAADWNSRPHFTNGDQVSIQFSANTGHQMALMSFVRLLRDAIAEKPNLTGVRQFLGPRRARGDTPWVLEKNESGETSVYFNWRKAGIKVQFDSRGNFRGRLEVRQPFSQGESVAEIEALPVVEPTAPAPKKGRAAKSPARSATPVTNGAARVAGPVYGPQAGENPSQWALRLQEASRSQDREVAHNIVLEMERFLADPTTAVLARETIERWVSLTDLSQPSSLNGIVARHYSVGSLRNPITIVSLPTTFLPESWSQVFAEGLAVIKRQSQTRPVDRAIEVGSGTGWASIVLAKLGLAREIVAVDMNPQAAAVGRLNAALNGVSNIRFEQGDLMASLPAELKADLIVSCLPQVRKNGSIQGLREVADYYTGGESYFDRFSLGLIERALVQARERLLPNGRILFNLGGRPGRAVLEDLYASQGFRPQVRFGKMIPQDAGTDISSLAAQESSSGLRFEFFHPENPNQAITATEALGIARPHHMLYFMEGRPYGDLLRKSMDRRLEAGGSLGYTREAGLENTALRESLAQEMSREWGFSIMPESLLLAPTADAALEGLLRVLPREHGPVLFAGLGEDFQPRPLSAYQPQRVAPRFPDIAEAVEGSLPSVLVLQLPREAWMDREGLSRLLHRNAELRIHTIVLEDQPIRLSNEPHPLMSVIRTSPQVAEFTHIVQALDRRYAAPALPLGVLVSAHGPLHTYLGRYADLTHSRASTLTQDVYAQFFGRFAEENHGSENLPGFLGPLFTNFSPSASVARALDSVPAFESGPKGEHPDPIDMSFGESEWKPPLRLGNLLWETAQTPRPVLESAARQAVVEYLQQTRGFQVEPGQIILGAGVQSLMGSVLQGLREIGGGSLQVAVPRPSYGLFFPTAELAGAKLVEYATLPQGRFLTDTGQIGRDFFGAPGSGRLSALLINEPSNPAGQYYSPESLQAIARQVKDGKGYLLFDDVFGMLDFGRGRSRSRRTSSLPLLQQTLGSRLVAFGGVSKEYAAGGLRFGFAVVSDPNLARAMQIHPPVEPDPLALNIAPELFRNWQPLINEHRVYLSSRAFLLEQAFRERHLPVQETQGGYSLFANLEFLHGRRVRLRAGGEEVIDHNNLHQLLYTEAGLRVHSDRWARVPGHYRFVFSIDRLDEAVDRLKKFFRSAR